MPHCSAEDLAAAWKYARRDAADNFVFDVIDHEDVERNLPHLVQRLAREIESGHYTPAPLLNVDVPKRPFTVRPGAVVSLLDLIVLYALLRRLAPALDAKLPSAVYSYRWLPEGKTPRWAIFTDEGEDEEIPPGTPFAPYPPFGENAPAGWFRGWIEYHERVKDSASRYDFCAVGDVTAYFENVAVTSLFDRLAELLGDEHADALSSLRGLYEFWGWQPAGATARGKVLPQGNDVSLFLSNFFLTDLDETIGALVGGDPRRYLRYVDDICIFADTREEGQRALLACDRLLRELHLSLNAEKTEVLPTSRLFDQEVESWAERVSSARAFGPEKACEFLRAVFDPADAEKWERPYLRALTTLQRADSDDGVPIALPLFLEDPTYKLLVKNFDYLRAFASRHPYGEALAARLTRETLTFPYHKHFIYRLGAYGREDAPDLRRFALQEARRGDAEWYLRMAALFCLHSFNLTNEELEGIEDLAERESHPEVARAALVALRQRPADEITSAGDHVLFTTAPGQENLREYFYRVRTDEDLARTLLAEIRATDVASPAFVRRLHQLDLLKGNASVRAEFRGVVEAKLEACGEAWPRLRRRLRRIAELASLGALRHFKRRQLARAQDHLETVLRRSQEAVILTDRKGEIQIWNDAARELLGYTREEAEGWDLTRLLEPPGGLTSADELLAYVVENGGAVTEDPLPHRRPDGTTVTVTATYAAVTDPSGEPAGLSVLVRDVTAEIRAAQLEKFQAEAEKLLADTSGWFIAPADVDHAVTQTLQDTATLLRGHRGFIVRLREDAGTLFHSHEWCAPGTASGKELGRERKLSDCPLAEKEVANAHALVVSDAETLPPAEREITRERGTRAFVAIPFFIRSRFAGLVGVDDTERPRSWEPEEINLLFSVTAVIAKALERREAEEALKERERFLASIFSSIQDGISILDTDLNIIRVNATLERWYSHVAPLAGKKCYDAYHGRNEPCERCPAAKTLHTGKAAHEVVPKRGPGGETVGWIDLFTFPLTDIASDEKRGVIEYVRDITDRKRAEEKIKLTQQKYQNIFDTANDAIFILDPETGAILDVNKKMCEIFGYSREEVLTIVIGDLSSGQHPYTQADALKWIATANTAGPQIIEWMAKDKAGRVFPVEVNLKTTTLAGERRLLAIVRDVTERQRAEKALQESEREKTTILENLAELVAYMDRDLDIVWVNPAAADWAGLTPAEVVGRRCHDVWFGRDERCEDCHVARVLETGQAQALERTFPDGSIWHVQCNPVRNEEGEAIGVIEVSLDVTEQKRAGEALRRRAQDLKILNDMAIELATLPSSAEIGAYLCEKLNLLTNALGSLIADYDADANELSITHYDLPSSAVKKANKILGLDFTKTRWPLHDFTPKQILSEHVAKVKGIPKLALAIVPRKIEETLAQTFGIGHTYILSRYDASGALTGILSAVTPADAPDVPLDTLETFAHLAASALERKHAEEKLAASEERYRDMVELAPDGIATLDLRGVVTSCNTSFLNISGYTEEEIVGRHFAKLPTIRARDIPQYAKMFGAIIKRKSSGPFEFTWIRKDGTVRAGEAHISLKKAGLKTVGIQVIARDITERKQAENKLRKSEETARALLNAPANSAFLIEPDGTILSFNKVAQRRTGLEPEGLYGRSVWEVLPSPVIENRKAYIREVVRTGEVARFDEIRPQVVYENYFHPWPDAGGRVARLALLSWRITERKILEEALAKPSDEFRRVAADSPVAAFEINRHGKIAWFNDAARRTLGYGRKGQLKRTEFAALLAGDGEGEPARLREILSGTLPVAAEFVARKRDGATFPAVIRAAACAEAGEVKRVLVDDVSERSAVVEALAAGTDPVEVLARTQSRFAIVIDAEQAVIAFNEPTAARLTLPAEEIKGKNFAVCLPAVLYASKIPFVEEVINSGEAVFFEDEYPGAAYENDLYPIFDAEGNVARLAFFSRDVSYRRDAAEALHASEETARALLHAPGNSAFVIGPDGTILDFNDVARRRTQRAPENLRGRSLWEVFPRALVETRKAKVEEAISTRAAVHFEEVRPRVVYENHFYPLQNGSVSRLALFSWRITERKLLEEALARPPAEFRAAAESSPVAAFEVNRRWKITWVNRGALQLLGYTRKGQLKRTEFAALLAAGDERATGRRLRILTGEDPDPAEFTAKKSDGETFPVTIRAAVFREAGTKKAVRILMDGLGERARVEELVAAGAGPHEILSAARTPFAIVVDGEETVIAVNEPTAERLKLPAERIIGLKFNSCLPPALEASRKPYVEEVTRTGRPVSFEDEYAGAVYDNDVYPIFDAEGNVARLAFFSRDITYRRDAAEALRASEARFRELLENAPLGYLALDAEGRISDVNERWLETLGYAREEVTGKAFVDFLAPKQKRAFEKSFARFKDAGKIHGVEFGMIRKDGSRLAAVFDGQIARDEEGNFLRAHCLMRHAADTAPVPAQASLRGRNAKRFSTSSPEA